MTSSNTTAEHADFAALASSLAISIEKVAVFAIRSFIQRDPELARKIISDEKELFSSDLLRYTRILRDMPSNPIAGRFDATELKRKAGREESMAQGTQRRKIWRLMIDVLLATGFAPSQETKKAWLGSALNGPLDLESLEWLWDRGVFSDEVLSGVSNARGGHLAAAGLVATLSPEGPKEMAMLDRFWAAGLAGGKKPLFGITDLVCDGSKKAARHLAQKGERPFSSIAGYPSQNWQFPIEAFLGSMSSRWGKNHPEWSTDGLVRQQQANDALGTLRELAAWGATVADKNSWGNGTSNAFAALMGDGVYNKDRAISNEMLKTLGDELVKMGADLNDGGRFAQQLAKAFTHEEQWNGEREGFDPEFALAWAIGQGFDPSRHAAVLHCAAAGHDEPAKSWAFSQRFAAWGADIASIGTNEPSPVRVSLEKKRRENVMKYANAGAPMEYVDASGGCALHFLAEVSSKAGVKQMAEFLANPKVAALIELELPQRGHALRPLHQACLFHNEGAIRLLLAAGADVNAQDALGRTPLRHLLRKSGKKAQETALPLAKLLLAHGADPSIRDEKGFTPAQSAAGKAPMKALAELMALRPQDLGDDDTAAVQAKGKLRKRGGQGLSLAEQADLAQVMSTAKATASGQGQALSTSDAPGMGVIATPPPTKRKARL